MDKQFVLFKKSSKAVVKAVDDVKPVFRSGAHRYGLALMNTFYSH